MNEKWGRGNHNFLFLELKLKKIETISTRGPKREINESWCQRMIGGKCSLKFSLSLSEKTMKGLDDFIMSWRHYLKRRWEDKMMSLCHDFIIWKNDERIRWCHNVMISLSEKMMRGYDARLPKADGTQLGHYSTSVDGLCWWRFSKKKTLQPSKTLRWVQHSNS